LRTRLSKIIGIFVPILEREFQMTADHDRRAEEFLELGKAAAILELQPAASGTAGGVRTGRAG
jgi:hypothetical protein